MRSKPRPQEIYRHFKGKLYQIITLAVNSETGEELVIYQALYDDYKIYARSLLMFMEEIEQSKYRFMLFEPSASGTNSTDSSSDLSTAELNEKEVAVENINGVDPLVLEFLGAESHEKRLQILTILRPRITDSMICTMAVSLDLEIAAGDLDKRYDELRHCLMTMRKFEVNR